MIKGIAAMLLAALISAGIIVGFFHLFLSGIIYWFVAIFAVASIVAILMLFGITFIFCIIIFFALFYYLAEKTPEITPGEYKLDEEKGKNE